MSGSTWDRLKRAAQLEPRTLVERIRNKAADRFGYWPNVRRLAWRLDRHSRRHYDRPYAERGEAGPVNLEVKLARQRLGGPFEPHNITLLNRAAVSLLAPHHRRILEIGSGTGMFASLAVLSGDRQVTASEQNAAAREWAMQHRASPRIEYCDRDLRRMRDGEFDLAVAIEVIEHVAPFAALLGELRRVAPEALITTPNKSWHPFRSIDRTPAYSEHVREWTAGEFFWVLRCFYGEVRLYAVPDQAQQIAAMRADAAYVPRVVPASDLSCEELIVAICGRR